jgi:four helix bundle protein
LLYGRGGAAPDLKMGKRTAERSERVTQAESEMPPVFHRMYTLVGWLLDRVETFPRNARFTFGEQVSVRCLSVIEKLVRAAYGRRRAENLEAANVELEVVRVFVRLCKDRKYISIAQYEYAMEELLEVGRMIGGWLKSGRHKEEKDAHDVEQFV